MNKKFLNIISICLVSLLILSGFAGCGKKQDLAQQTNASPIVLNGDKIYPMQ